MNERTGIKKPKLPIDDLCKDWHKLWNGKKLFAIYCPGPNIYFFFSWRYMVLYGPLWSSMVRYGPLWSSMVLYMVRYGHLWSAMVLYGPLWSSMVLYGPLYGPLWSSMVRYGPLWSAMLLYGPLWSAMVRYGPIWSSMKMIVSFVQRSSFYISPHATFLQYSKKYCEYHK